jgi:hypothetical protein
MGFLDYFNNFYVKRMFGPSFIFTDILFCLCIVLLFNDRKYDWKGILIKLADLCLTWLFAITVASLYYWIFSDSLYSMFVIWPCVILAHAFLMNSYSWFQRCAVGFTLCTLLFLSIKLSAILGLWFIKVAGDDSNNFFNAGTIIIFVLVLILMVFLKRFSLSQFKTGNPLFLVLLGSLAVITTVILIVSQSTAYNSDSTEYSFDSLNFTLDLGLYLICGISYFMFYGVTKEQAAKLEAQNIALKSEKEQEVLALSENNLEELKKIRHDIKNQYGFMKVLLQEKDYAKLNEFFTDLSEATMVPLSFIDCGNNTVSSILNFEAGKARKNGIHLETNIVISKQLGIQDPDICSLLTNLIDNALESMINDSLCDKGAVSIRMFMKGPYLIMEIANPVKDDSSAEERMSLHTRKGDKSLHGYGTKIVKSVVERYHGAVSYNVKDGVFTASVMLLCNEEGEQK